MLEFIKKYPAKYWRWYLAGTVFLFATNYIMALIPRKVEEAIDLFSHGAQAGEEIFNLSMYVIVLAIILVLVRTLSRILIFYPGRFVEYDIRNDIFAKLITLSGPFYSRHKTGDLMSRAAHDIQNIRLMFGFALLSLANTSVIYAFVLYQMLSIDATLTAYTFIPIPFIFGYIISLVRKYHQAVKHGQEELGRLTDTAVEGLSATTVIKSFRAEDSFADIFDASSQSYKDASLSVARYRSLMFPFLTVIGSIGNFVLFLVGGKMILEGTLTVGEFTAFSAYIALLAWPTAALAYMLSVFQRGLVSLGRIQEVLDEVPEIQDNAQTKHELKLTAAPKIEVRNLSFTYSGTTILDKLNFQIEPGTTLGIFGLTGSGKSTLAKLFARILKAPEQTIFWNDVAVEHYPLSVIRGAISYVPQDSFLFSESIAGNIGYSRVSTNGKGPEQKLVEAAEMACVHEDIHLFPDGFQTLVGEKGIVLSGGQKNRIALARALYKDFRFLILDDVLSAVDHNTEQKLISNIRKLTAETTSIIISHRVSALTHCDKIIVLENGSITAHGTHETLIKADGIYTDTWRYQKMMG